MAAYDVVFSTFLALLVLTAVAAITYPVVKSRRRGRRGSGPLADRGPRVHDGFKTDSA